MVLSHGLIWSATPATEGVELPVSHHQSVHANGTLSVSGVTRAADAGRYLCTAVDKLGRSDSQTLQLHVNGEIGYLINIYNFN